MSTDPLNDAKIVASWGKNALPWTVAVREGRIESRQRVTDRAIVDAILSRAPRSVLDIGCGEGWLMRELARNDIRGTGIDAIPQLVETAREAGGGDFHVMSYEELAAGHLGISVDMLVCNFSLLGKASVEGIFGIASSLLNPRGSLIVQTLHPIAACDEHPYRDGWRHGSWAGCGDGFSEAAPWYFRSLESWTALFVNSGFRLTEIREPLHPTSGKPASVIFMGNVVD